MRSFHHVEPYLTTRSLLPENQEAPMHFLRGDLTPERFLFRRNHFPYPDLPGDFQISVSGKVQRPFKIRPQDLVAWNHKTLVVALECAGNKPSRHRPQVFGDQWEDGAIGQSAWTGVPLADLLQFAGLKECAQEIVFVGADRGHHPGVQGVVPFARSLPVQEALHPDILVACQWNGREIPYQHGYPLRLIVPHWYGMASVKWLQHIYVHDQAFQGPFQMEDYQYYPHADDDAGKHPVTYKAVNSTIRMPLDWSTLNAGIYRIEGTPWSGTGPIERVEISLDQGQTWKEADLERDLRQPHAWTNWMFRWNATQPGEYELWSRATDAAGRTQPLEPYWNRKGYGYNAIYKTRVRIK